MNDFYWDLTLKDGTVLQIPPESTALVQRKIANREAITLKTRSVLYSEILSFNKGDTPFGQQNLLEEASVAFNEPIINPDESIACRWVKKTVTNDRYNKYYGLHGGVYRKLNNSEGMVDIAFKLPLHMVNLSLVAHCTKEEVQQLEKYS
jgi:hypothetical protein